MIQLRPDHLLILPTLAPNLSNHCTCLTKSLASRMLLNIIKMADKICSSFTSKFSICCICEHGSIVYLRALSSNSSIIFTSYTYTAITLHLSMNTFSSTIVRLFTMYSILIRSLARNMNFTSTKHLTRPNTFARTVFFCSESHMERSFLPTQPSTLLAL